MHDRIKELETQLVTTETASQKIALLNELAGVLIEVDLARALTLSNEAYQLTQQSPHDSPTYRADLMKSLRNLGTCYLQLSQYDDALLYASEALTIAEETNDLPEQAHLLNTIGEAYRYLGNYADALEYQFQTLKTCRTIGDTTAKAQALNKIGVLHGDINDYSQALTYLAQSLQLYRQIGHQPGEADALDNYGIIYRNIGDYPNALSQSLRGLQIYQQINDKSGEAKALINIGEIYKDLGNYPEALNFFHRCLEILSKSNNPYQNILVSLNLGDIYKRQQKTDLALKQLHQALSLAEKIEARKEHYHSHQLLAQVYKQLGDYETALAHHEQFYQIRVSVFNEESDRKLKNLQVSHRLENAKKEAEIYQLKNIKLQAELTEHRQTEETFQKRNIELALLNQASQIFSSSLELSQVLETVLDKLQHLLDIVASSFWLCVPETGELVCRHATGPGSDKVIGWRLKMGEGLAGWVAQTGQSLIIPDMKTDQRHFKGVDKHSGLELHSLLSIPLKNRGRVIGVLNLVDTKINRFAQNDLAFLEPLAATAATAIENARLYTAAQEEIVARKSMEKTLRQQNSELDAFARTVAHDLKGPLSLIAGYIDLLAPEFEEVADPTSAEMFQEIQKLAYKAVEIVEELLLLSRIRKEEVEMKLLDMAQIVSQAQSRVTLAMQEYQGEIVLPESWPRALGYAPWVEEVWGNYLSNGLKYGGQPPRLELGATSQENGMIKFWVQDNGAGISPDEQAQLFTEFTRLSSKHTDGHGLGLSIVRRIMDKLGGQAGVESEPEQGSRFYFTLPSAEFH